MCLKQQCKAFLCLTCFSLLLASFGKSLENHWGLVKLRGTSQVFAKKKKNDWLFKMWIEKIKCKESSEQCSEACSQTVKLKRGNMEHHLAEHTESDLLPYWVSLKQNLPTSVFNRRPTFSVSVFCIFPYSFIFFTASKANQMLLPILYELFLASGCEGMLDFLLQPLSKKAK